MLVLYVAMTLGIISISNQKFVTRISLTSQQLGASNQVARELYVPQAKTVRRIEDEPGTETESDDGNERPSPRVSTIRTVQAWNE